MIVSIFDLIERVAAIYPWGLDVSVSKLVSKPSEPITDQVYSFGLIRET
jgi:hypothetical protein